MIVFYSLYFFDDLKVTKIDQLSNQYLMEPKHYLKYIFKLNTTANTIINIYPFGVPIDNINES